MGAREEKEEEERNAVAFQKCFFIFAP